MRPVEPKSKDKVKCQQAPGSLSKIPVQNDKTTSSKLPRPISPVGPHMGPHAHIEHTTDSDVLDLAGADKGAPSGEASSSSGGAGYTLVSCIHPGFR